MPPESLVEQVRSRLGDELGDVQRGAVLDDFPVDKLSNLGHGIVGRAVKLIGLADTALIVQHQLKGVSNLRGLGRVWSVRVAFMFNLATYMNGPGALLHIVGSEDVGEAGKLVKEVVLETEHRGRADNGGLGVDVTDNFLTPGLKDSQCLRKQRQY